MKIYLLETSSWILYTYWYVVYHAILIQCVCSFQGDKYSVGGTSKHDLLLVLQDKCLLGVSVEPWLELIIIFTFFVYTFIGSQFRYRWMGL